MLIFNNQISIAVYSESLSNKKHSYICIFNCLSMREILAKFSAIIQISTFEMNMCVRATIYNILCVCVCVCMAPDLQFPLLFLGNTVA